MPQTLSQRFHTYGGFGQQTDIGTDFAAITGFGGLWTRDAGYNPTTGDAEDWAASTGSGTWNQTATAAYRPTISTRFGRKELVGDATKVMQLTGLTTSGYTAISVMVTGHLTAPTTTNQRIIGNNLSPEWRLNYRYSTKGFFEVEADGSNNFSTQLLPTTAQQAFGIIVGQGSSGVYIAVRTGGFEWDIFDDTSINVAPNVGSLFLMGQSASAGSYVGGIGSVAIWDRNIFDTDSEFRTVRDAANEL